MKNKFFYIALILIIPLLLNFIWFRNGNILGHGESGLPFYNPKLELNIVRYAWSNYTLGLPASISVASAPFYWMFSKFQNVGIPGYISQAFFFWSIFVISGIGIFLFTSELFPKLKTKFLILATLFYWFNPFSLINVWNRFLNTFMVFYGIIPLELFLFIHGLRTKKYIYAVFAALLTAVFSYAFTAVAFGILFWSLLFFTTTFYIFVSKGWQERFYVVKFFLITLILFILMNFWWISQIFNNLFFGNLSTAVSDFLSKTGNYQTLSILSQQLGNFIDLVRLRHGVFFGAGGITWLQIYNFPLIVILEFVVFGVILCASIINRKNPGAFYLTLLLIIVLFLAKGNSPPFGELFEFLFLKFAFLQAFRNPFEKIMFIAPLAFSSLFALGLANLFDLISVNKQKYIYTFSLLWLLIIWGYPFWTGLVFTSGDFNAVSSGSFQVKVPQYYDQAAEWLNSKQGSFRLLVLPIGDEGITYSWDHGYSGIELSNQILPVPSISFNTTIPYYNDIVVDINPYLSKGEDITEVMNLLNVKYIMLRRDINWKDRGMQDPQDISVKLFDQEKNGRIKKVAEFGEISFWENLKWKNNEVFATTNNIGISPTSKISDLPYIRYLNSIFLSSDLDNKFNVNSLGYIIHPEAEFTLNRKKQPVYEIRQDIFPYVKFLPSNIFYKIFLLKEDIDASLIKDRYSLVMQRIVMLGKRLVEAETESDKQNSPAAITAILGYQKLLHITESLLTEVSVSGDLFRNTQTYKRGDLYDIFLDHQAVLSDIQNKFPGNKEIENIVNNTKVLLSEIEVNLKISPHYGFVEIKNFPIDNRVLYKFNVNQPGEYDLFWGDRSLYKYYIFPKNGIPLQVNSNIVNSNLTQSENGQISLGKFDLASGVNEIGLNMPKDINLIEAPQELVMNVNHGKEERVFPIKNLDPYGTYYVTFDYLIDKGSSFTVSVVANNNSTQTIGETDKIQKWLQSIKKIVYSLLGKSYQSTIKVVPSFSQTISPDFENWDFSEKNTSYYFSISGASSANLIFEISPSNNCKQIFHSFLTKSKCNNPIFSASYDKTAVVHIKNVKLVRVFTDEPVLVKENSKLQTASIPKVDFTKIGNSDYSINVKDASEPFILVLSELYDNGWRLYDGGIEISQDHHFLANIYANGWAVDKRGNFNLEIKYVPQDLLSTAEKISIGTFFLGTSISIWFFLRRIKK